MKLGVRRKLVILLIAIAVLPLAAAVATIGYGFKQTRSESFQNSMLFMAQSEALARRVALTMQTEAMDIFARDSTVEDFVAAPKVALPQAELDRLDKAWPTMPLDQSPMKEILNNPVSRNLRDIQQIDPRIKEILVTDRFGQLVAATGRSTDYYQADEEWWQKSFASGKGAIYIPPVTYDASSGHWSVEICMPVDRDSQVLGVLKAVIDVTEWSQSISTRWPGAEREMMLVSSDGLISYRKGLTPMAQKLPEWYGPIAEGQAGWRISQGEIQGFAPIDLPRGMGGHPVESPSWSVVVYTDESAIMTPIYQMTAVTVVIGAAVIAGIFYVGLLLIDRSLLRRIVQLEHAIMAVAKGDMTHRIPVDPSKASPDEIDRLAKGFNDMIDQVQESTLALQSTNELKTNFIRVAGHELRTPVSYILGMARLLKDSSDPARLQFGVQSMGSKARRLNEIIQAMFKLMPDQLHHEDMRYVDVDVNELMEEIYVDVFPFVEKRNQRLIIDVKDKPLAVSIDRDKIHDVIENLLINAIKFTPDGGIIKVTTSRQLGDRLMISVQDQGPGIPEADYPRLFQPFYSGSDVMTHSTGDVGYQKRGIGLGLAIARHFVELHHGTMSVSSSPMGSTFSFTIPIQPPAPYNPPQPTP